MSIGFDIYLAPHLRQTHPFFAQDSFGGFDISPHPTGSQA